MVVTCNFTQAFSGTIQVIFGSNRLGDGNIISGLGFMDIRYSNQSNIKPLFGLIQLAGIGSFFGFSKIDSILGRQYAEIRLGNGQSQALLRSTKIGFCLGNAEMIRALAKIKGYY